MAKPKSDNLFHFTKNLDYLKNILLNGLFPRFCLEDVEWFNVSEHVAYAMVCFCDIPLSRISDHTDFYGNYGIGLSKDWGLKNRLNPVVYSNVDGIAPSIVNYLFTPISESETTEEKERRTTEFVKLFKIIKPLSGKMYVSGNLVEKDFYQESEWRYTPEIKKEDGILFKSEFDTKKDKFNKYAEEFKLDFLPSDIKYIFVKEDSEIPSLVDFINHNLGKYPLNDLKILNSRIISLETISLDL